jgi:hypothetical protein
LRRSTLACALLVACAGVFTITALSAAAGTRAAGTSSGTRQRAVAFYTQRITSYRLETWYWQRVMGVRRTHVRARGLSSHSVQELQHLAAVWRRNLRVAARHAHDPPNLQAWLCIHRHEGSWVDDGAPYYGGLQMDISFQRAYGSWLLRRKGTANHWTPLEQIWTAEKARRSRGFYPWPNTARSCGLM